MIGEQELCARLGEAHEDQAGQDGGEGQAGQYLHRSHAMAEQGGGIHVAVADGGQRLQAEEKMVQEDVRPRICHRPGH